MSRKLMLQLLGMTAGFTLSAWGHAVGLGGINVVSALGQPLKAEIELVAVGKTDKPGLVARLASPDAYKGAGLDYPYNIKYSFEVGNRANGEPYLKLSSNREITDPFVSLLVELSWSSGKLMREYTFLLDPPGYAAAQPKPAAIQEVIPAAVQSAPLISIKQEEEKPVASAPVARQVEMPAEKPVEKPVKKRFEDEKRTAQAKPEGAAKGTISVKHGDSLNKIAAEVKPDDVSLERMLVALYRANADQFDSKNMNRIKSGKILRMPDHDEIMNVVQAEAVQEIHAQSADWNAYRQKLASAATTSRETEAPRQVAAGKITSTTADKTPVAAQSAKEVLRLSKGETPGDKTGAAGRAKNAQDKSNAAAEEAIAKGKAVKEEKTRAALLDANLKDMQRLAQLKAEAASLAANAAAAKVTAASAVVSPAASAVVAASAVAAASQVQAASHVAAASSVKPAATKEASLLDQLLDSKIALGLGAAVLLALGGLGIALNRRRQAGVAEGADAGATTGQLTSPVVPSPETGDFTAVATSSDEVATHVDDIDPISEADLFLNFGRDEQAEEVLKDALQHSPDNHQIHLKLLGIYANRGDAASFEKIARLLQDSGDDEAMQQASLMGRKLDPANPLYGGEAADAGIAALLTGEAELPGQAELTVPASVDEPMSFEIAEPESVEALEEDLFAPVEAIDFDVTATHPMAVQADEVDFDVTSAMPSPAAPETVDFDIAAKEPEPDHQDDEALPSLDDLIFDVMSPPGAPVEAGAEPSTDNAAEDDGMEFTLDFPADEAEVKTAPLPASVNLADISLDMDDIGVPAPEALPAVAEKSEHWHEVATKIDLARAYQEMGDEVGAREILDEVMLEGDDAQQQEAQSLISQLG